MTAVKLRKKQTDKISLAGRIAFVTGAGSGIGKASAMSMADCGAHVVATDLIGELAEATAQAISENGGSAESITLDMTDDTAVVDALDKTIKKFGRLDILHSHAGIQVEGTLEQVSPEGMDESWRLNVRSHFVAARTVVGQMRSQGGGSVIITSSNSGVQYDRQMIAYATTKHAVVAMVRQMAADYAKDNVRFNALCPGWVDTPFNAGFETQMGGRTALESYIANSIPMGRWAQADEIADAVVFLASDLSTFMTGQALVIDGGECI